MKLIISSYAKENKTIGLYEVNNLNVKLLDYDSIVNPSFVVKGDDCIYTYEKTDKLTLYSYKIIDSKFIVIDKIDIEGTGITHLVYSKVNSCLIGCSYPDGTFFSVEVKNNKFVKLNTYSKQINDERLSRCHCVFLNEDETEVGVVNIALDKIYFYNIKDGNLIYTDEVATPLGSGPRHALYNNNLIYTVTEYSNEVIVIDRKSKSILQQISTVPNFKGTTYGATLVFSSDKKFLYATNRGEETIAKFEIINSKLVYINSFDCGGKHPRHMIITKDGKYIINCNKNSNNVSFFDTIKEEIVLSIDFSEPTGIIEL